MKLRLYGKRLLAAATACVIALSGFCIGELQAQSLTFERVTNSLNDPIFGIGDPSDSNRMFIVQQSGQIRLIDLTTGSLSTFMTVPNVATGGERGLLGFAFHPDYLTNGYFYVNYTYFQGSTRSQVRRFTTTDYNTASSSTGYIIMDYDQPQSNHNGGWIGFGDDELLYVATGDGGAANDDGSGHTPGTGNAQDLTNNWLGKLLRVDPNSDDFPALVNQNYAIPPDNPYVGVSEDDEIYCYGLRNPWRCSFDRHTGHLYMGDVGQNAREEISLLRAGESAVDFGWRLREGTIATPGSVGGPNNDAIDPIYDYLRGTSTFRGFCTTGGYVYRGPITKLTGMYFFGDYSSERIFSLRYDGSTSANFNGTNFVQLTDWTNNITTDVGSIGNISSFAQDSDKNLYVFDHDGEMFKLTAASVPVTWVTGYQVNIGTLDSGTLVDVRHSDDDYMTFTRQQGAQTRVQVEYTGTVSNPSQFLVHLESKKSVGAKIQRSIRMYNWNTNEFESVDLRDETETDEITVVDLTGDMSKYIESGTGNVKIQLTWLAIARSVFGRVPPTWSVDIDRLVLVK